jgi:hypothetical protein
MQTKNILSFIRSLLIVQQHRPGTLAFDPLVGIFRKLNDLLVKRYEYEYPIVKIM